MQTTEIQTEDPAAKSADPHNASWTDENSGTKGQAQETEATQMGDSPQLGAGSGEGASACEGGSPAADAEASLSPEEKIAALEAKVAEINDLYLRKAADFENFRKRMQKEKQDAIDFANQSLLLDLIGTLDDFERALTAAAASGKSEADFNALLEGVGIVEKRLITELDQKWGLKRFDSAGTPFDPARHEALMMEKSAEVSEATVQEDYAKGFMLRDRVVRAAKVKVLMPEG